ncbi:hypothetical protein B0H10DRAFT_1832019, partial [Mycena sp. CBHHK59/15]
MTVRIDKLERASDHERGLSRLDSKEVGLVEKLKGLAEGIGGDIVTKASGKRKKPGERKEFNRTGKKATTPAVFTKKENATLAQRIEILDWYHTQMKPSQVKTAQHFAPIYPNLCIKQPLISSWLKEEKQWRDQWVETQQQGKPGNAKRVKQVEHPEVEDMLELWIAVSTLCKYLADSVMFGAWKEFYEITGHPERLRLTAPTG